MREFEQVALRIATEGWPAGSTGTVVDELRSRNGDSFVLVELDQEQTRGKLVVLAVRETDLRALPS